MSDTTQIPPRRSAAASHIPGGGNRTVPPPSHEEELGTRAQAVCDLVDIAMMPLATAAAIQQVRDPDTVSPYTMDLYAVEDAKAPIAKAVVKIAANYPVIAAILDKVGTVSPAAEMLMLMTGLVMQLAENHSRLPNGIAERFPGVIPREELENRIRQDGERMAAEMSVSVNGS